MWRLRRLSSVPEASEGPAKQKRRTHPSTCRLFFLDFFPVRFWVRAVQKNPNKSTQTAMSVCPRFFSFYHVFGCFSAMGVQKHHKKRFTKKSKKVLTKKSKKNPKPFFYQKQDKNITHKKSDPRSAPTHHVGHRSFLAGPLT
jgi:hypothetical protein